MNIKPKNLRRLMNLWPPFWGSGIRVLKIDEDWRYASVRLRMHWYNRNYVRTHFGGSLFAMTDPFWMIMVWKNLGDEYRVWDKAGEIEFVMAIRDDVYAEFQVDPVILDELRAATKNGEKYLHWFDTEVKTMQGEVVARIRKQLYVRRKQTEVVGKIKTNIGI